MEAVNDAPYLSNRPKSFVKSADVILKLDSGDRLPAHPALLSLHSDVLSDMLSLDRSSDTGLLILPFPDCIFVAALTFLQCIYATCDEGRYSVDGAGMVAELAFSSIRSCLQFFCNHNYNPNEIECSSVKACETERTDSVECIMHS